jgi:phenylacetic acid degradation operon negative regulatory protein
MELVVFAFGAASACGGLRPDGALAGRALMRLLAELGLSPGAARSLLLRMRHDGWLGSERDGREAWYRLSPAIAAAQVRVERQLRGQRPPWPGYFNAVLYEIPEQARPFRDRLRRTAQFLGYVTLRPGLLISTTDRWPELGALLPDQPAGSQLLKAEVALSAQDSRAVAARRWDLDALASRYRQVTAETQARTSRVSQLEPGAAAFRAFAAATLPVYEVTADDPDLPAELLPADWPGDQLTAALGHSLRAFYPLISDYLTTVTHH